MVKEPNACADLSDVRAAVRDIDREIVQLLARRERFVHAAVQFKKSESELRDRTHIPGNIEQRRAWAKEFGANADLVANIYRVIFDHSEVAQRETWRSLKPQ